MTIRELKKVFKEGIKSVLEYFQTLRSRIKKLEDENVTLKDIIVKLNAEIEGFKNVKKKNQDLKKVNKEQKEKNSKDSHNSSKPSSTDNPFTKDVKNSRKKSVLKPGGQKGHEGKTLRTVETPDKIKELELKICDHCNASLKGVEKEIEIRQQVDVLIKRYVTEFRAKTAICPCCNKKSRAKFPDDCPKKIQYGPILKALASYLNKFQLIPLKRTKEFFQHIVGIPLSEGSIVNFNKELYNKTESFEDQLKELLVKSKVMNVDESGGRCNKKLHWFHVMSTKYITYFRFHANRGREAMNDIGILLKFKGKSVHDFYSAYFKYLCEHVLCNAHLLRELIFEDEVMNQQWSRKMIKLLLKIKKNVDGKKKKGLNHLPQSTIKNYEKEFDLVIKQGLRKNPRKKRDPSQKRGRVKQTSSRNLLERLKKHRLSYLAFMYDFDVPFDNNQAERDIRMVKLYMKISGCFRKQKGADIFCRIRSYIYTVRKNGLNPFTEIKNAFQNEPFTPKNAE